MPLPTGQLMGHIQTLPGLDISTAKLRNRVVFSNGHARPMVSGSGSEWAGIGLRPPLAAPSVPPAAGPPALSLGAGDVTGDWRFFTQYYDRWRGVASNLSPPSDWTGELTKATVEVRANAFEGGTDVTLPGDFIVHLTRDSCDYIRLWAQRSGSQIKLVEQQPISQANIFTFNTHPADFDAILAEDRIVWSTGNEYRGVSVGNDIFPACEFIEPYAGRLWGLGQANYRYEGAEITVTKYDDLPAQDKDFVNGGLDKFDNWTFDLSLTRVATGNEIKRAKVVMTPRATDVTWTKIWDENSAAPAPNADTYVAVNETGSSLFFVINNIVVAHITSVGDIYISGEYKDEAWAVTMARTGPIDWLASPKAICVNVNTNTAAAPVWLSGICFTENGDLFILRNETKNTNSDQPPTTLDDGGTLPPPWDPVHHYVTTNPAPPNAESYVWFLPVYTVVSDISTDPEPYSWSWFLLRPLAGDFTLNYNTLTENAELAQLRDWPLFDTAGFMYKRVIINGEYIGWVWDVDYEEPDTDHAGGPRLWLAEDVDKNYTTTDWEIIGLPYLFYSKYNEPESGYFGHAMLNEGLGSFLYGEFDPGDGLTPVGLSATPDGLEVIFREKSYIIRAESTATPIPVGGIVIEPMRRRDTTYARKSIARDREQRRLSLVSKPKGVARIAGGRSEILTDAAGNRIALASDIDQATAADACGAYFTDKRGDVYILSNLDRVGETGGEHSLMINLRGDQMHTSRLDEIGITALTVIETDDGNDRLIWGDSSGRVGTLLEKATDFGDSINWKYRLYLSPADLQTFTITGLRVFAQSALTQYMKPHVFLIKATIYDAGGNLQRDDLIGRLHTFEEEATFTGSGLDDATFGGAFTDTVSDTIDVQIATTGAPDTIRWRKGLGDWSSNANITGAPQELSDGVFVEFAATTGHTQWDNWRNVYSGKFRTLFFDQYTVSNEKFMNIVNPLTTTACVIDLEGNVEGILHLNEIQLKGIEVQFHVSGEVKAVR